MANLPLRACNHSIVDSFGNAEKGHLLHNMNYPKRALCISLWVTNATLEIAQSKDNFQYAMPLFGYDFNCTQHFSRRNTKLVEDRRNGQDSS